MIEKRTVCPYDCPDSCGIIATIENDKLVHVRGDKEHERTKGFLCRKMAHYEDMVNHPNRILHPMKRIGTKGQGLFQQISWDEALHEITEKWKSIMEKYGSEAILPYSYAGTEGRLNAKCGEAFFHYLGASKLRRTICSSGKGAGWEAIMGASAGMPPHKLAECDRILIWGSNLAATRIHDIPSIQEARNNGAYVTLIDVYKSPAANYCDDTLLITPGSDGALALAMIHVLEQEHLIDYDYITKHVQGYDLLQKELPTYTPEWASRITGLSAANIRELAISYGQAKGAGIVLGSGPSRHFNGAMNTRCTAALPAVTGALKNGFGLVGVNQSGAWGNMDRIRRPDFDINHARTINMMQLASALDKDTISDPPVMSLYVYSSNPALVTANQKGVLRGLAREDLFTVVHERFMTDTAKYADIILPAVFSLESNDIFTGYGFNGLQYAKKIIDPPGECCSNWDVFRLLAQKLNFQDSYFTMTEEEKCMEYLDRTSGQQAELSDLEWADLLDGKCINRPMDDYRPILTKSGKVELYNPEVSPALIGYVAENAKQYPLRLVAAPSLYSLNSTFTTQNNLMDTRDVMTLLLSDQDAKKRGIVTGDIIICENQLAAVEFHAEVSPNIANGTVVAEGIYDLESTLNGLAVNALFSEGLSDLGEATTMNGNFVEVCKKSREKNE